MARSQGQGQQQSSGPPRIVVEFQPAEKTETGWKVTATAIATKGNKAVPGAAIQFYAGTAIFGVPVFTDDNGRASTAMVFPKGGEMFIDAQIVGENTRGRALLLLPKEAEEKKQKPVPGCVVKPSWVKNRVYLAISTFHGIQGDPGSEKPASMVVEIIDTGGKKHKKTLETDSKGSALYEIRLTPGKEREVTIMLPGFADAFFSESFSHSKE